MPFYDLNVPWTSNTAELQRTVVFLSELGYDVIALTQHLSGKLPADLSCPIPSELPFPVPPGLRLARRCTLILTDSAQNHRLRDLNAAYDILALRPTDERTLQAACQTLDCDLISLDLTLRYPFHFRFSTLGQALNRGLKFEICYSPGVLASDGNARRNVISNATQLIRATRGRGLVISSEASRALGCRSPWDVVNLAAIWGLQQERGTEAVSSAARSVVVKAALKRSSFRGVVDIVHAGEKPAAKPPDSTKGKKREAVEVEEADDKPQEQRLSNREKRRRAKQAKLAAAAAHSAEEVAE